MLAKVYSKWNEWMEGGKRKVKSVTTRKKCFHGGTADLSLLQRMLKWIWIAYRWKLKHMYRRNERVPIINDVYVLTFTSSISLTHGTEYLYISSSQFFVLNSTHLSIFNQTSTLSSPFTQLLPLDAIVKLEIVLWSLKISRLDFIRKLKCISFTRNLKYFHKLTLIDKT